MKEKLKTYGIIALGLLMVIFFFYGRYKLNKLDDKNQLQAVEISTMKSFVEIVEGKNKELTFKISSVQVESDNRKEALEKAGFDIREFKGKEIKWRNLESALRGEIESLGKGSTPLTDTVYISLGDTIRATKFNWSNKYLSLNGSVYKSTLDFDYRYSTGIQILSEKKGKSTVVSVILSDPQAKITTANSITIVPDKHWWNSKWLYAAGGFGAGWFLLK